MEQVAQRSHRGREGAGTADGPPGRVARIGRLVGAAPVMRRVCEVMEAYAEARAPVLVIGERGTGKGLVARLIHELHGDPDRPLLSLNCAAVPESLAESELFGHKRGAFTGATCDRDGLLLTAFRGRGGLLLDDVAELPAVVQPKLLHAVEDRVFYPVGSDHPVRITGGALGELRLYATSQPSALPQLRGDLRDRLGTCVIELPPLRERGSDVLLLADRKLAELSDVGRTVKFLDEDARGVLVEYDWPGNVRQLHNVIERAFVLSGRNRRVSGAVIGQCLEDERRLVRLARHVEEAQLGPRPREPERFLTLKEVELRHIRKALKATAGNVAAAARLLGLKRTTLQSRLRKPTPAARPERGGPTAPRAAVVRRDARRVRCLGSDG